jgi:asparagine synthase (glutamine-hydrolysing)
MAHSREVRLPFLDRRIAEFAFSLPARHLYEPNATKLVLREAVRSIVPASILEQRDKIGFETPQAAWFRTPRARQLFAEILLDPAARTRELLDREAVERDLSAGLSRDTGPIWRAVNSELWMQAFSRGGAPAIAAGA